MRRCSCSVPPLALLPRWRGHRLGHCLLLPSSARSRLGLACWHASLRRESRLDSSVLLTSPHPSAIGQACACVASTRTCCNCCLAALCARACVLALLRATSRAEPSPPCLSHAQGRVALTRSAPIKGPPPPCCILSAPHSFPSTNKPPRRAPPRFSAAHRGAPPHCLSFPLLAGPRAAPRPTTSTTSSPMSRRVVVASVSSCATVTTPP
jgi:hypothetical protein